MAGERTEGHSEKGDITRDYRSQTQEQDSPAAPDPDHPMPEQPRENAEHVRQRPSPAEPACLTGKRAASLSTDHECGYEGADANNGSGPLSGGGSASHVCLCQPEPKIPRPRNAFILFRQHHHATVVAQHPGLSNPEISKIIGEQWRGISPPERNQWKNLAEEEKLRHQQQYPEYKYQPRRNNRKGLSLLPSLAVNSEEFSRCAKCGGRSLVVPSSPSPSLSLTPQTPNPPTPGIPSSPFSHSPASSCSSNSSRTLPRMNTLHLTSPNAGNRLRQPGVHHHQPSMGALPLGSLREQPDEEALTPLTPETKRRRFNSSLPTPNANGPITRSIASRMEGSASRSPYPMDPPPRPHSGTIVGPPNKTPGSLPPLQTTPIDSVKAMVMTIPFINKIKVISRISPPLSPPGPLSPPHQIRGTIIAIDGNDTATTEKLFRWLEQALRKTGEYAIRSFEAPLNHFERCDRPAAGRGDSEFFVEYLGEVLAWHRRTGEIIRHVTQLPAGGGGGGGERVSQPPPTTTTPSSSSSSSQPHPHPISLLPHYILTRSNTAASHIPINDRYAPVDHWQWMATLWRGCVGPDFTVYARADCPPDEFAKCPAVEMRPDAAAVVVRSLRGAATVWEDRVLRRLGFEVGEWVKGGEGWGGVR